MNRIPSESELWYYRCRYPSGTRIQLDVDMDDEAALHRTLYYLY